MARPKLGNNRNIFVGGLFFRWLITATNGAMVVNCLESGVIDLLTLPTNGPVMPTFMFSVDTVYNDMAKLFLLFINYYIYHKI